MCHWQNQKHKQRIIIIIKKRVREIRKWNESKLKEKKRRSSEQNINKRYQLSAEQLDCSVILQRRSMISIQNQIFIREGEENKNEDQNCNNNTNVS